MTFNIYSARKWALSFVVLLIVMFIFSKTHIHESSDFLNTPFFIIAGLSLVLLTFASISSKCPHCREYLTFKRNWVGKHCKHCGEKIEPIANINQLTKDHQVDESSIELDADMRAFLDTIYSELDDLFAEDELKTQTTRSEDESKQSIVRLTNQITGQVLDISDYETQLQNAILGKIRLLKQTKKAANKSQ